VGTALLSACDTAGELIVSERKWNQLFVVSAVPATKEVTAEGDRYQPVCRSSEVDPAGMIFNMLFQGTANKKDLESDRDLSIIPLDRVDRRVVKESTVQKDLFEIDGTCFEPLPDGSLACDGKVPSKFQTQDVGFHRYGKKATAGRGTASLAILVDMSGSMKGLVYPFAPYFEDSLANVSKALPPGFDTGSNATDPNWARIDAVEALIKNLNDKDQVILFTFNETKIDVACNLDPSYSFQEKKQNCLSEKKSLILEGSMLSPKVPIRDIKGTEKGRSPLWTAVEEAYGLMKTSPKAQQASFQHILVITDGPDTCAPSPDLNRCSGMCAQFATSYETVRAAVEADEFDQRIPIHFVQLQARGYRTPDPLQQEIACLSGGQYVFINTLDIQVTNLKEVLEATLKRIGYMLRGHWKLAVKFEYLKKGDPDNKRGYLYALSGTGVLKAGDGKQLVKTDSLFSFLRGDQDAGSGDSTIKGLAQVDRRLVLRKECKPGVDACLPKTLPAAGACHETRFWCDEQSLTCRSAEFWSEDGTDGGCADTTARIQISIDKGGSETVNLGTVPTKCCHGRCIPPRWPEPPWELVNPEGSATSVYFVESSEWVLRTPSSPEDGWVVYANYKQNPDVSLAQITATLNFDDVAAWDWNDHWDCDDKDNCFPPAEAAKGSND
jgi:hypothetical protein